MIELNRREAQAILDFQVATRPLTEREAAYYAALELVASLDEALTVNSGQYAMIHLWHRDGQLLTTLDDVVRAILDDDLAEEPPKKEYPPRPPKKPRPRARKPVLCGHPDEAHFALNMCRRCWGRDYYRRKKAEQLKR